MIIHSDLRSELLYLARSPLLNTCPRNETLFLQRARARLGRLERKVADMRGVSGSRRGGVDDGGTRYSYSSSRGSGASAGGGGERAAGVSDRWRSSTTASSGSGSSRSSTSSSSGRTGEKWEKNRSSDSGSAAKSSPPPSPPRTRKTGPGGTRRADDPEVEAELARLKREMGL